MTLYRSGGAHVPHDKKIRMQPFCRMEILCMLSALLLCLLLAAAYLFCGANSAFLHFSVPGTAVLFFAKPAPVPSASATPAPRAMRVDVETAQPAVQASAVHTPAVPQILIYHTHATEAYMQTPSARYEPSGSWRTLDNAHNVVAVGKALASCLEERYGLSVIHDTANYEPPKLASAYSRSLAAIERYKLRYPSLTVFIDVHRDAFGNAANAETPSDFIELDGQAVARVMCVVGTGEGATGAGFDKRPDFENNLALAQSVTDSLRKVDQRLARDIRIKTGRYNQHVASACLLVEIGHNANTLSQALSAVPYLASAIAESVSAPPAPNALTSTNVWSP